MLPSKRDSFISSPPKKISSDAIREIEISIENEWIKSVNNEIKKKKLLESNILP